MSNPLSIRAFRARPKKQAVKKTPHVVPYGKNACPGEHEEQKALMIWATAQVGRGRWMLENLFAIPNGGDRHPAVAGKLKAEGVMSGVPDLLLAWPSSGRCGLFIEMKRRKGGRVSTGQELWHGRLRAANYAVAVCKGCHEAQEIINHYLGGCFDPPCGK